MNKELLFKKLESISNLPTLPAVMQKLGQAIRDPHADAARIAGIIKDDPAMMTRIIKVVNSSAYGLASPVQSLQQAISILGISALNNIALSTAVFSTCSSHQQAAFDRNAFWRHCICTGIAANILSKHTRHTIQKRFTKDVLHLCGLLHDIGKILLDEYHHAEFLEILARAADRQIPLCQAEFEICGTNHAEIGAWLARRWNLSDDIIQAIRWHHDPENADVEHVELLRLCHAANHICNVANLGFSGDVAPAFERGVWKRIGLSVSNIHGIVAEVQQEAAQSETMLAVLAGDRKDGSKS
jgi:putative nucleotidyltransferase with HDIG domain